MVMTEGFFFKSLICCCRKFWAWFCWLLRPHHIYVCFKNNTKSVIENGRKKSEKLLSKLSRVTEVTKVFLENHENMSWELKCLIFQAWWKKNETKCSKRFDMHYCCIFPSWKNRKIKFCLESTKLREGSIEQRCRNNHQKSPKKARATKLVS